jgi:ABC-type multidrug transport system permease subunit
VGYNPATWMLECIGAGVGKSADDATDFVQVFNHSTHHDLMMSTLDQDGVARPSTKYDEITFTDKRAADSKTQFKFLMQRFFRMYWRTPTYNLTRYGSSIFLAVLFGIIFVGKDYDSYSGLNSGVGIVFMAAFFNAMISYQSVLPLASVERASFYRERAAQTYNAFYYWLGAFVVEIPYVVLCSLVFTVIFYPFVGFKGFKGGVIFWLGQTLLTLMQTYMGQMCAYALPSEEVANIIGVLIISIFSLFLGFSPPAYAIPSGYKWLYDIAPQRFPLSILVSVVFADCDELPTWNEELQQYENVGSQLGCQPMKNSPETVGHITLKEYTEQYFGYNYDDIAKDFIVVIGYNVLFLLLALAALRFINHQKR